jgi:hypothetical protein
LKQRAEFESVRLIRAADAEGNGGKQAERRVPALDVAQLEGIFDSSEVASRLSLCGFWKLSPSSAFQKSVKP